MALLADKHADIILVGDSVATVIYGHKSTKTLPVSTLIEHAKAVRKAVKNAILVVDVPYLAYSEDERTFIDNCNYIYKETGADALKIEPLAEFGDVIFEHLKEANSSIMGFPIMGHVGLKPQEGLKIARDAEPIIADLKKFEELGAFASVIEGTAKPIADEVCEAARIPLIGIGASAKCEGQILVAQDILGFGEKFPSFVKKYADFNTQADQAFAEFAKEVKGKIFPSKDFLYD